MMIEPRAAKYPWGMEVIAAVDLYNDGSLPDVPEDQLVIVAGGPGEIVQIGHHTEANVPLYMVDFGIVVLGCTEEEILPAHTAEAKALLAGEVPATPASAGAET